MCSISARIIGLSMLMAAPAILATASVPTAARIPLCAGLTIVTAISEPAGDYETIKSVEALTDRGIRLHVSAQRRVSGIGTNGIVRNFTIARTVLPADLKSATLYMHNFMPKAPIEIPGSTALGTSTAVLRALKTSGSAEIGLVDASNSALSADRSSHPNVYDFRIAYTLKRISDGPPTMPITLDGVTVPLPVIRARGIAVTDRAEFVFLDDEDNPLTLALRIGAGDTDALRLQVVRISTDCTAAARAGAIERALTANGRIDIYDIFFDFNSDRLREESAATLREIGEVLRRHPEWKLSIEGHTDAIASESYNLDLSRRRAAAVKETLTTTEHIAADRLSSTGFGKSRPRDTNDTLEGRARNRRVELVRQ